MGRVFDRNMLIMLVSIMVGVVVITFFIADIVNQQRTDEQIGTITMQHEEEIGTLEAKNLNFTKHFLKSLGLLDQAREDRASGNYNFELAFMWYKTALEEDNMSGVQDYKDKAIPNCEHAMVNYSLARSNFVETYDKFNDTIQYTSYEPYIELLHLYLNLSKAGEKLCNLRYNASLYLKYLTQNLTYTANNVTFLADVTLLLDLFAVTELMYSNALVEFNEIKDLVNEYDIAGFDEHIR